MMTQPIDYEEPWWAEEDDDWSEDAYWQALASYFEERWLTLEHKLRYQDCE